MIVARYQFEYGESKEEMVAIWLGRGFLLVSAA